MEFKDWQKPIIELILSDKVTESNPIRALDALYHTRGKGHEIKRSSVVLFLQGLAEEGLLNRRLQSGRGGYHGVYWDADALAQSLKREIICSGCGKKHWLPETNKDGVPYSFLRCNCGHENPLRGLKGSANSE